MLKTKFIIFFMILILLTGSALAEWEDFLELEPETTETSGTEQEENADDLLSGIEFGMDFDGFSVELNDDDLEPMSEEELLRVLSEQDQTDFLVIPEESDIADTDLYTLLLIGSDSYEEDKLGRADTTILMQVNAEKKTIKLVSFLRDMYLPIPGRSSNRLNAAYIWGGERLLRKTLKNQFGVEADAYMEVNFARMIRLIDGIGGVTLDVTEEEQRQVNSILRFYNTYTGDPEEDQLLWESGNGTHLTGKQALCYARIRKIDNDVVRTERQRKVIEAAFHQVMGLSMADMTNLVMENLSAVATDLSLGDCLKLIPMAIRCQNATISTLTIPYAGAYSSEEVNGMSVLVPNLRANRKKLQSFLLGD